MSAATASDETKAARRRPRRVRLALPAPGDCGRASSVLLTKRQANQIFEKVAACSLDPGDFSSGITARLNLASPRLPVSMQHLACRPSASTSITPRWWSAMLRRISSTKVRGR